jgi:pSer/pThr/pTyr-binding forkhead associated (FHA) protein
MNKIDQGIFCPACKMKNETGAIICIYCNTPLQGSTSQKTVMLRNIREVTGTLPDTYEDFLDAPAPSAERFMDFEIPSTGIVLINLENGQPITIQEENTFILGRVSAEIKTDAPLVDLTPFQALDLGISRVHASISKTKDGYQITDLESSNGTWHENQRLTPREPYPLESGDRIRVGRLNILVFYPRQSKN